MDTFVMQRGMTALTLLSLSPEVLEIKVDSSPLGGD